MDMALAVIACLCTCFVSCFHAWLDYRREKTKDPLWEAALSLMHEAHTDEPEEFIRIYEDLLFYKEHRDLVREHGNSLSLAKTAFEDTEQSDR